MLTISTWPVVHMSRKHSASVSAGQWAWLMGVATMANKEMLFVMVMDRDKQFEAHTFKPVFFADSDWLVTLTSCSDA